MIKSLSRWLLPLSLAVNISLATIVVMNVVGERRGFHPPPPGPPSAINMAQRMAEDLPKADAQLLLAAFKARESEFERGQAAMKAARDGVQRVTEIRDPAEMRKAFDAFREARDIFDNALAGAMTEALLQMSDEGRKKMSVFKLGPPPPPGGGGGQQQPPMPPR